MTLQDKLAVHLEMVIWEDQPQGTMLNARQIMELMEKATPEQHRRARERALIHVPILVDEERLDFSKPAELLHMHYTPGEGLDIAARHPVVFVMAQSMVDLLDDMKAPNYVETSMYHKTKGRFIMTVQRRTEGKTPHELRAESDAKLAAIREILADSSGKYASEVDRTVAISAIVF